MEIKSLQTLAENPFVFMCLCLGIDIVLGDPAYSLHPIRVLGKLLSWVEKILRQWGGSGRIGGVMLFLILLGVFGGGTLVVRQLLTFVHPMLGLAWELYLGYSLLALGDLVTHGKRIARETLQGNLDAARQAASMLVGRDTDRMNFAACNRAAVRVLSIF